MKNYKLYNMLKTECQSQIAKAELTLDLLQHNPAGIGDHSTDDFYKNATEALTMLTDGKDRLARLDDWWRNINGLETE
jgi:hypothetical protein